MTIVNSTIRYYVPQPISCVNYTAKLVFGLTDSLQGASRYSVAPDGVTLVLTGDSTFDAPITDPVTNKTCMPPNQDSASHSHKFCIQTICASQRMDVKTSVLCPGPALMQACIACLSF